MFPTFVWKAELVPEVHRPLNASILRELGELGAPLVGLEPGASWQSDHMLHEAARFREVLGCIAEAAAALLEYLKVGRDSLQVTGCWANVSAPGAGHREHSHPNNYLSGVYYVQTQEGADTINFHDPRPQTGIIRPPASELTADNTDQVVLKVGDGTMLLFPAWLPHSVDANRGGGTRVSLSFNLMFAAYTELMAQPLWAPGSHRAG